NRVGVADSKQDRPLEIVMEDRSVFLEGSLRDEPIPSTVLLAPAQLLGVAAQVKVPLNVRAFELLNQNVPKLLLRKLAEKSTDKFVGCAGRFLETRKDPLSQVIEQVPEAPIGMDAPPGQPNPALLASVYRVGNADRLSQGLGADRERI